MLEIYLSYIALIKEFILHYEMVIVKSTTTFVSGGADTARHVQAKWQVKILLKSIRTHNKKIHLYQASQLSNP